VSIFPAMVFSPGAVINPNLVLLMHMDGTDGSTTIIDDSPSGLTFTAQSNGQLDTGQKQFGTSSYQGISENDGADTPNPTVLHLSNKDWSIDMWFRKDNTSLEWLISTIGGSGAAGGYGMYITSVQLTNSFTHNGGGDDLNSSFTWSTGTWYHIEAKASRTGNTVYHFVDGVSIGTHDVTGLTNDTPTLPFAVGRRADNPSTQAWFGHIDEVRMLVGEGGHTANFTPKTSAYDGTEVGDY